MGTPLASFENPSYRKKRNPNNVSLNARGAAATPSTLTTALTGANNDVLLKSKLGVDGSTLSLKITDPACFSFSGRFYEGGTPSAVTISPASGTDFRLVSKAAGSSKNNISITLTNPGGTNSLSVSVSGTDITVSLATSGGTITSTAATVVAAINADVTASALVEARLAEANSGAVAAVSKTNLAGGSDDTGRLEYWPATDSSGTITATADTLVTALNTSTLVTATVAPGNDGSGVITALAATSLAGALSATGRISVITQDRVVDALGKVSGGDGMSKTTLVGNEVRGTRTSSLRTLKNVTSKERTIEASSSINYPKEHGGVRSPYL